MAVPYSNKTDDTVAEEATGATLALASSTPAPEAGPATAPEAGPATAPVAAKKPNFKDCDLSTWCTKSRGKNSHGGPNISVYNSSTTGEAAPKFAFFTPSEQPNIVTFRINLERREGQAPPKFLSGGGDSSSRASEGFDMTISINKEQLDFMERADQWLKGQARDNCKEWFGREYDNEAIRTNCNSSIRTSEQYDPTVKTRVIVSGMEYFLTRVVFRESDGKVSSGKGWSFVSNFWNPNAWRNYAVRLYVQPQVWVVKPKYGLRWAVTDMLVMERSSSRQLPFDESECAQLMGIEPSNE